MQVQRPPPHLLLVDRSTSARTLSQVLALPLPLRIRMQVSTGSSLGDGIAGLLLMDSQGDDNGFSFARIESDALCSVEHTRYLGRQPSSNLCAEQCKRVPDCVIFFYQLSGEGHDGRCFQELLSSSGCTPGDPNASLNKQAQRLHVYKFTRPTDGNIYASIAGGHFSFGVQGNALNSTPPLVGQLIVQPDTNYDVTFVYDGEMAAIYVDGELDLAARKQFHYTQQPSNVVIGAGQHTASHLSFRVTIRWC